MNPLFARTSEHLVKTAGADIFVRTGGSGPPLLLIHGFPQSHVMWHRVAPELMKRYTVVMPDLRGYGQSSCPANDGENLAYSKRAMAADMVEVMDFLGFGQFSVAGHDRGGRVAYRLALDRPQTVTCLVTLDIVPTWNMWTGMDAALAMKVYHWQFLAQPHPLPEMLIGKAPVAYLDHTLASWTKAGDLSAFCADALAAYRLHYQAPERIHATCNDYRAGQTYDFRADSEDRAQARRIACPTLVLWGDAGIPAHKDGTVETGDPLGIWREWCTTVEGFPIDSGHFIPEENPQDLMGRLLPFLDAHAG